LLVVGC
jgi:hypothetical protein